MELQLVNMLPIVVTFRVSKWLRSRFPSELHDWNIPLIVVTDDVLKRETSRLVRELQS